MSFKEIIDKVAVFLKQHWPVPVVLSAAFIIYFQTVSFGCVDWDDSTIVLTNPYLKDLSFNSIKMIFTPGRIPEEQMFIPLTYLSFFVESFFFGLNPGGLHFVNFLLHCINAVLVYFLILQLTNTKNIAFFTSLIFTVHPLQVETVAWIMGRKDILSSLFSILSLLLISYFITGNKKGNYLFSFIFFVFAVLSKPSSIILPGLVLLFYYYWGRLDKKSIKYFIPFVAVSVIIFYINSVTACGLPGQSLKYIVYRASFIPSVCQGWVERIMMISPPSVLYSWYSAIYEGNPFNAFSVFTIFILCLAIALSLVFKLKKLFLGLMFTVISFIPAGVLVVYSYRDFVTADRYGYFPLIGVFFLISSTVAFPLKPIFKVALLSLFIFWAVTASYLSYVQVQFWKNAETLWSSRLRESPECSTAHYNLGNYYFRKGDLGKAENHYREAVKTFPDYDAYYNLAFLYEFRDGNSEAVKFYKRALSLDPLYFNARRRLAFIYYKTESWDDALEQFMKITEINPLFPEAYLYIGDIFLRKGDKESALNAFLIYEKLKKSVHKNNGNE